MQADVLLNPLCSLAALKSEQAAILGTKVQTAGWCIGLGCAFPFLPPQMLPPGLTDKHCTYFLSELWPNAVKYEKDLSQDNLCKDSFVDLHQPPAQQTAYFPVSEVCALLGVQL